MEKIGDFSKRVQSTIKTLRHYDKLGLLIPCHIDPQSGYRHYGPDKVIEMRRITHQDGNFIYYEQGKHNYGVPFRWGGRWLENRIFGIKVFRYLQEATGGIFNPKWQPGYTEEILANDAKVYVESAGQVKVIAGTFENCIKVTLTQGELNGGKEHYTYPNWKVGHGIKEYYFAPNVGIIKLDSAWGEVLSAETQLINYSAKGQGYMPIEIGNMWEYQEMTLTEEGYSAIQKIKVTDMEADSYIITDVQEIVFLGTEEEYLRKFGLDFPLN